ncbi:phospho-N-acetylmuramoyl-pentapeptide-transferase [Baaleninema simplex]|uniref:phospho-N-acetylmuramoyl-pentapeptide- transferase n=1 Tax=Baaleninema simplex TaxID=2862350 RepID=UPI00034B7BF3|nr:phospho-N-acetylmuramoyl-pentapeptide-transferase [Baaleninema simplex]
MDTKVSNRRATLTGGRLSWGLAGGLSLAAIGFDVSGDRLFDPAFSLTLPLWVGAALSAIVGVWGVPVLQQLKTGQVIRQEGPQAHFKKAGTPTMGGILFVPAAAIVAGAWVFLSGEMSSVDRISVVGVSALTLAYAFIGWLDDWQVLRRKSNKGISPRTKLALQIGFAILFCAWAKITPGLAESETVQFPGGWALPLGALFWLLAGFVLVAESNATNLTDGLDGLMGGTGAIAFLGLAAIVAPTFPGLALFCAIASGACLGFLAHNRNPARVFMGDTGSLALGGALAAVGVLANVLFGLLVLSGLFFAETLSVIAQVGYYKATKDPDGIGKRLFKMAPLHHHFELSGWSELQVVATFYGVTAILALIALVIR